VKQSDLKDMFKNASKSICTSTIVVYHDPLSPSPSTSSAMKTPEKTEEGPEPAEERDMQVEYSSD
jgi:hypothetical protein